MVEGGFCKTCGGEWHASGCVCWCAELSLRGSRYAAAHVDAFGAFASRRSSPQQFGSLKSWRWFRRCESAIAEAESLR